jgi:hypothetical protein
MKVKLKKCDGCEKPKPIWKNHEGKKYCKICWSYTCAHNKKSAIKKPKNSISPRSSKKHKEDLIYSELRKDFLLSSPTCKAHIPGMCTIRATEVHHTFDGSDRSIYYLDVSTWLGVCRQCHDWIHQHTKEAKALNLLK